jgi:hypothetical protein
MQNDTLLIRLISLSILLILVLVKTTLFFKIADHKRINNWFHFDIYQLVNSPSVKIEKAKKLQNGFTGLVCFAVVLVAVAFYLTRS